MTRKVEENEESRVLRKTRKEKHLNTGIFNSAKCFRRAKASRAGRGPFKNSGITGDLVRGSFWGEGAEI